MTINVDASFLDQLSQWATASTSPDPGDPIETPANIQAWIDDNIENIGTLETDPEQIGAEFEERGQVFYDPADLLQHWLPSGMIFVDEDGNVTDNPLLTILKEYDERTGSYIFTVWVGPST
jgi:hypothetical protein